METQKLMPLRHGASQTWHLSLPEYILFKHRHASVIIIIIIFEIKFQRELETLIKSISAQPSCSALHVWARVEHSLV